MRAFGPKGTAGSLGSERTRHAEVHEERVAGAERRQEVLTAPADGRDGLTGQSRDEIGWKGPAQIRPAQFDTIDARASRRALEHPADSFDFGEFRHLSILLIAENGEHGVFETQRTQRSVISVFKS